MFYGLFMSHVTGEPRHISKMIFLKAGKVIDVCFLSINIKTKGVL